jgi:hypothetical protein
MTRVAPAAVAGLLALLAACSRSGDDAGSVSEASAPAVQALEPGSAEWIDALVDAWDAEARRDRSAAARTLLARLGVDAGAVGARELQAVVEHVLDCGDAAFAFELAGYALERHPNDATLFEVRERADARRARDARDSIHP